MADKSWSRPVSALQPSRQTLVERRMRHEHPIFQFFGTAEAVSAGQHKYNFVGTTTRIRLGGSERLIFRFQPSKCGQADPEK